MRPITAICRVPIRDADTDGTFLGARPRLCRAAEAGFDTVCLDAFDSSCGSTEQLLSLCTYARQLGFTVLLALGCLYDGVHSPVPLITAAEERGWCDGVLLDPAARRFPELTEALRRHHKECRDFVFVWDEPIFDASEKVDGALRRGFDVGRLLDDASYASSEAVRTLCRTRHALYTPLTEDVLAGHSPRYADAALALALLLPGVPLVTGGRSRLSAPSSDGARRGALLAELLRHRRHFDARGLGTAPVRVEEREGYVCVSRRLPDGVLWLFVRTERAQAPLADRVLQSTPPLLCTGVYRTCGLITLPPLGVALCFVPRTAKVATADGEGATDPADDPPAAAEIVPDAPQAAECAQM